jgi:hypothetical protein
MFFWEKSKEGRVCCSAHFFVFVSKMKHSGEIFLNDRPTFFVKMKSESIRTRGFVFMKLI